MGQASNMSAIRSLGISVGMMDHELYSCSRCRKLKKKCSKELPKCNSCIKANCLSCEYPGKAPRRTRKQIEAARLRGEEVPAKRRRKTSDKSSDLNDSDHNINDHSEIIADTNSLRITNHSNMDFLNHPVSSSSSGNNSNDYTFNKDFQTRFKTEKQSDMYSTLTTETSSMSPQELSSPDSKAAHFQVEGVNSLITALSSMHGNSENKLHDQGLMAHLQRTTELDQNRYLTTSPDLKQSNTSSDGVSTSKPFTFDAPTTMHENFTNNAVPIVNSAIQREAVRATFKVGEIPDWKENKDLLKNIDRNLFDRFIAAYFQHNHRTFPMIDKRAFLSTVSTIRDFTDMSDIDDALAFKLNMIMAIGCTTLNRAGLLTKDRDVREHFVAVAMSRFFQVLSLQNVETIKCLLLLGIYSFFEPRGVSSWTISGLTMRLTISLGLYRALPLRKMQTVSAMEVELRSRVFWSAYCYERLVATSLGRLSAIDDDEISVPLPHALYEEEKDDIEVTLMTISLRQIGGKIYKKVHSISCGRQNRTIEEKQQIINDLCYEINETCQNEKIKIQQKTRQGKNPNSPEDVSDTSGDLISFHNSDIWLEMRHAQLQILLYRPSFLIPKPQPEAISKLGEVCLEALKHTYTLYQKKLLPLNWITLFRVLTICNTMLYCLCQWGIDLVKSEKEIKQCVEILRHFGESWIFAVRCADVFQNISNRILEISLTNGKVPNMDQLTTELFGANNAYQEILDENNVDVSWVDRML